MKIAKENIGPTGKFPKGKLNKDDEGELGMRIGTDEKNGKVIIDFGSPVHWIGLDADDALKMAELLTNSANKLPSPT